MRKEFRKDYRLLATESANEALEALEELKKKGEEVALFLSDQRMPEMLGVDFLEKARQFYPDANRILLTAYSDTEAAIKAINDVQLDYYLMKPWDPPEEKLYPDIPNCWRPKESTDCNLWFSEIMRAVRNTKKKPVRCSSSLGPNPSRNG